MGKNKSRGKKREKTSAVDAVALAVSLPQVETLRDIPSFSDMRIDDAQRAAFDALIEQLAQADAPAASEMQLGCVVRLDRVEGCTASEGERERVARVIDAAFAQRRKTIRNSMSSSGFDKAALDAAFEACGIAPTARAETLEVEDFVRLTAALCKGQGEA